MALFIAGCSADDLAARQAAEAATEQAATELKKTNAALMTTTTELDKTERAAKKTEKEIAAAGAERIELARTAQTLFDAAVAKMEAAKDDSADQEAIAALRDVADRFPLDPLAETAVEHIDELKQRVEERAKKLAEDQSEVRKLIKTCRTSSKSARKARDAALQFNSSNNIDMNAAMAGERRANKLEKKAENAKAKAEDLLGSVPDPDGELAKKLAACDESD